MSHKPAIISYLESRTGAIFSLVDRENLLIKDDWIGLRGKRAFSLNEKGEIIGLSLDYMSSFKFIIQKVLEDFVDLEILSLKGCSFENLGFIKKLSKISQIDISSNSIKEISFLTNLKRLNSLDLSYNKQIGNFSELEKIETLTHLNVSSNNIRDLSFLRRLAKLKTLNLSYNTQISNYNDLKALNSLKSLNLRYNNLSDPSILRINSQLSSLDLSSNRFNDISFLENFSNLANLGLSYLNDLDDYSVLKILKKLELLNLRNSNISSLNFLQSLESLESFDFRFNKQITDFSVLNKLNKLTYIDISYNSAKNISFIRNLHKLKTLWLGFNPNIIDYSPLEKCKDLVSLYISSNEIRECSFLRSYKSLKALGLNNNKLTDISFLRMFPNLEALDLRKNGGIIDFSVIGSLNNLVSLDLSSNYIKDITFLKGNSNLTTLQLNSNRLTDVSIFKEMDLLQFAELQNNPIKNPPESILNLGLHAIKNYFKQGEDQGTVPFHEVRILLVGEPGAGKTSLVNKLIDPTFPIPNDKLNSTSGIDIHKNLELRSSNNRGLKFKLNFWDFGGQQIQYHIHQFFLSPKSVYILVSDNRKQNTEFDYWLETIKFLGEGSPVLVVLNQFNYQGITNFDHVKYQRIFRDSLVIDMVTIDLTNKNISHLGTLKEKLYQLLRTQDYDQSIPRNWGLIRDEIENVSHNISHITFEHYKNICQKYGINDEQDQLTLSSYLHNLGIIIHFQHEASLTDFIILNPQWAIDAIYMILSSSYLKENKGAFEKKWLFEKWGESYSLTEKIKLLSLMGRNKLNLVYQNPTKKNHYLAPYFLTTIDPLPHWNQKESLRFRYQFNFLPKGLIAKLIVRLNSYIHTKNGIPLISNTVGTFERFGAVAKVSETKSNQGNMVIDISILGESSRAKIELMTLIREEIPKLHNHFENIDVAQLIPCNCQVCSEKISPNFYSFEELQAHIEGNESSVFCHFGKKRIEIKSLIGEVIIPKDHGLEEKVKDDKLMNLYIDSVHGQQATIEALNDTLKENNKKSKKVQSWIPAIAAVITLLITIYINFWAKGINQKSSQDSRESYGLTPNDIETNETIEDTLVIDKSKTSSLPDSSM